MNSIPDPAGAHRDASPASAASWWRTAASASLCVLLAMGMPHPSWAEQPAAPAAPATGSAEKAASPVAESVATTPWYDAEQDRLVPIPVETRRDDTIHRDSRWLPQANPADTSNRGANQPGGANSPTTGLFGTSWTLGNLFGWALLLTLVLGIVGTIVYAISKAETNLGGRAGGEADARRGRLPDSQTLERIKHLPPELRRTDVNLRSECERLMRQGEFDQAIILLLGHQLLLLDQAGLLRLARGKTNGRYVREVRGANERCAGWLRATADAFERSYFGRHAVPGAAFEQLWQQNQVLESVVDGLGTAK